LLDLFSKHRTLIHQLTKRDVLSRYRGSQLGLLWSFAHPVFMLLVYMFVFGVVFKMKWGVAPGAGFGEINFGVILFSGLVLHGFMAEVLVRSSGLITGNPQYVKKVVFPLPVLAIVTVVAALFHLLVGIIILLVFAFATGVPLHPTIVYMPLVLLPFVMFMLGSAWFISAICVLIRDIAQILTVVVTVLLFVSPVFYPLSKVPEEYRVYIYMNPLTTIIEQFRKVVLFGQQPDWMILAIYFVVALVIMIFGYWFFNRVKRVFADVV